MKSMQESFNDYISARSTVWNRVEGMEQTVEEICDDNDLDCRTFFLPSWGEELKSVDDMGDCFLTFWEYIDPYDSWDTSTDWHIPKAWFAMDRQQLEQEILKKNEEYLNAERERELQSLKRQAERLGVSLVE